MTEAPAGSAACCNKVAMNREKACSIICLLLSNKSPAAQSGLPPIIPLTYPPISAGKGMAILLASDEHALLPIHSQAWLGSSQHLLGFSASS
jgi:hypothetical protein